MNETPTEPLIEKTTDNDSIDKSPIQNKPTPHNNTDSNKPILNGNKAFSWYFLALIVLIIDQITKQFFLGKLGQEGNSIAVIDPVLNWTLAYNHGAAFSFLANQGGWQKFFFAGLALSVSSFLIWYIRKIPRNAKLLALALAMILGGAIGNLIDRIVYGYVIDFIHVHYADIWDYPVFNIADCGIIGGVIFMVYDMLFLESKRSETDSNTD